MLMLSSVHADEKPQHKLMLACVDYAADVLETMGDMNLTYSELYYFASQWERVKKSDKGVLEKTTVMYENLLPSLFEKIKALDRKKPNLALRAELV